MTSKNVGSGKTVTSVGSRCRRWMAVANRCTAINRQFPPLSASIGSITPASLTVAGVTATNKVYDATTLRRATGGAFTGRDRGRHGGVCGHGKLCGQERGHRQDGDGQRHHADGRGCGQLHARQSTGHDHRQHHGRPLSTWIGGATGNWSVASNWDALPDLSNVLAVTVPAGKSVTYDAAAGTTNLHR